MHAALTNHTAFIQPTLVWCLIMPLIHLLSLISNILCILVFCSKTFIHKPIAIYFICLLVSDSTTLLIGYSEMLERESVMVDKSSLFCKFNEKIIHSLTEFIYSFMGKFCLEWMLYKVLWTRASTILLAILSIQRSRTFFSLSYRESRLCALLACFTSIVIASMITCFEWVGVQCDQATDSYVYVEVMQVFMNQTDSKEFYAACLRDYYNDSANTYEYMRHSLDIPHWNHSMSTSNESDCSAETIVPEFYTLTQSLLAHRNMSVAEQMSNLLVNVYDNSFQQRNDSRLGEHLKQMGSPDMIIKLFEKRSCHITLAYSYCLKFFNFLHSLSFGFNRHTIAVFFGNALPSFVVFLANLLSLKVIYFSKSLKYLKETKHKNRRKSRLQNDLRAFLVILIESFSVITISWGVPIFLTMYHCQALYVISISTCPQIKNSLVYFLFPDLFNSSTNCLLYSLSGKLFRRKLLLTVRAIFTCGRGMFWNVKQRSLLLPGSSLEIHQSNDPSTIFNNSVYSRGNAYRRSSAVRPTRANRLKFLSRKRQRLFEDDGSSCTVKVSEEQNGSSETQVEYIRNIRIADRFQRPKNLKTFIIDKVNFLSSTEPKKEKINFNKHIGHRRPLKTALSLSSSSGSCSPASNSLRYKMIHQRQQTKPPSPKAGDTQSITKDCFYQNVTSL